MKIAMLLAFMVGYAGGITAGYMVSRKLLNRKTSAPLTRTVGQVFGVVSIVPALMLGTVIGGNLGGGVGESASVALGYGDTGVPIGLGIGLFAFISLTMVAFTITGMVVGGVISGICKQYAP